MAKSTGDKIDELNDKLFGKEQIHPGVLIRMDQRLERLEKNPVVVLGYFLNSAGRIAAAMAVFLGAVGATVMGVIQAVDFWHRSHH